MEPNELKFTELPQTPERITVHLRELVRGTESEFVNEIADKLRMGDVELDLDAVQRIDAAGIAALISLHLLARDLGRSLTIIFLSRHVKEILNLVGLEPILSSHYVSKSPQSGVFSGSVAA